MSNQLHRLIYPTDERVLMREESKWEPMSKAAYISEAAFCLSSDADYEDDFARAEAVADMQWQRRKAGLAPMVVGVVEEYTPPKHVPHKPKSQTIALPKAKPVIGKTFVRLPMTMQLKGKKKYVRTFTEYQALHMQGWK